MKKNYSLFFLLFTIIGFAQAPANYYNNATGTGYALKTQLKNIISNGHVGQPYGTGLWSLYSTSLRDQYYENDNSLLDIYSENPDSADPYNYTTVSQQCGNYNAEGVCYNKEHLIPQSYFNSEMPMYSDAHHVVPSDGKVNGWRDNYPFGPVVGTTSSPCNNGATNIPCNSQNGSKKGNNANTGYSAGFTGIVFEPIDEFKGDVARSFFYFATRYETQMDEFFTSATNSTSTPAVIAMFDGSENKAFSNTFLNILITWHNNDPVSQKEIDFNNYIYTFQGNRNPFIDNPNYVCQIWSAECAALSSGSFSLENTIAIYPNPTNNHRINIQSETLLDEIQLINVNGQIIQQIKKPVFNSNTYTLENLNSGFYFLKLSSENQSVTKKIIVN
ncbi:endonuclease I [Flavobacterium arsenatis]|uniref:Endonuclease I n=1 Tax=Flavobacterium arsenatis TaxID=1484332 RepID=A0ABU1TQL2_9FLAO|nr:endonuclease [Flavobacterium arsenatis]MDR6968255.1 endonuclease I [Flavobacterium arsenatis]